MKVIACFIRMHDMYTMCHGIQRITSSICTCSALRKHISKTVCFSESDKTISWAHDTEGTALAGVRERRGAGSASGPAAGWLVPAEMPRNHHPALQKPVSISSNLVSMGIKHQPGLFRQN